MEDLVAYLKGDVDGSGPLRVEERIRRGKGEMSVEELLELFRAHVEVVKSVSKLNRRVDELAAGLLRIKSALGTNPLFKVLTK